MDSVINASIRKLLNAVTSPFEINPWMDDPPIRSSEISACIAKKELVTEFQNPSRYLDENVGKEERQRLRKFHIGRIAYFVVNGWQDPIEVDVGIPSLGYHATELLVDGWHRFAAAIFRGEKYIACGWGGEHTAARKMLLFRGQVKGVGHAAPLEKRNEQN